MPPRRPLTPTDPRHHTMAGYRAGCRQPCCRTAWATWSRQRRASRKQLLAEGADIEHGTRSSAVNWGCSCFPCRSAHADYVADWRAHRKAGGR